LIVIHAAMQRSTLNPRRTILMQHDDFLTHCARTLELSIQGQHLLAEEIVQAIRRLWHQVAQASERMFVDRLVR